MRLVVVTACALALGPTVRPQALQTSPPGPASPRPPAVSSTVAQAIQAAAGRVNAALEQRDRPALDGLLTASFAWVHQADGRVDSREEWLANAARGVALAGQRSVRSEHGVDVAAYGVAGRGPQTVVRIARVRLLDTVGARETWLRQTQVFIQSAAAGWQLAFGQGTLMYAGPVLDASLHARYSGTYVIDADRTLVLRWEDGSLFASFPNGQTAQIFLASPTEEAARTVDTGRLHFTVGADGTPLTAVLRQGNREVWRAARRTP